MIRATIGQREFIEFQREIRNQANQGHIGALYVKDCLAYLFDGGPRPEGTQHDGPAVEPVNSVPRSEVSKIKILTESHRRVFPPRQNQPGSI